MAYTVTKLARQAGVSTQWIRQLISEGVIKAEKFGPIWMIPDDVAEYWLKNRSDEGEKKS